MSLKFCSAPRRAQPEMPQRVAKRSAKRAVTIIARATVAKATLRNHKEAQRACLLLDFANPHLHARFYDILMRFFYLRWDNP